tara:strand:- start:3815 stop:4834 length:1020 start_codon:yes stop_codon:yes gene_type:complete
VIPHNKPTIGHLELKAMTKVAKQGNLSNFKEVKKFENAFANYFNLSSKNVIAVSNGTSALYLALWSLRARGKKVFFPVYSCSSLRHATGMIGAKERLLDVMENFPNMKIDYINKSKGITIFPHMYGFPSKIKSKSSHPIIEDVCQSLGAKINNKKVGLQTDIGIFSFYATKLITSAGQGGMIISRNSSLISEIRDFLNFDQRQDNKKRFNFNMTDVQAAMGIVQLRRIREFLEKRERIFEFYKSLGLPLLDVKSDNVSPVRYRTILLCKNPKLLIKKFEKNKIKIINPLEKYELLSTGRKYKNSINLAQKTISLPCYPSLTNKELNLIKKNILKFERLI